MHSQHWSCTHLSSVQTRADSWTGPGACSSLVILKDQQVHQDEPSDVDVLVLRSTSDSSVHTNMHFLIKRSSNVRFQFWRWHYRLWFHFKRITFIICRATSLTINFSEAFSFRNRGTSSSHTFLSRSTDSVDGWMHVFSLDTRGSSLHTLGQPLRGFEGNAIWNMCTVDRLEYDL